MLTFESKESEEMASHPVDVHVGSRLRARRTMLGLSQEELGEAVGITFQQIQKYERGLNRIGSSRLFEFSKILKVNISYFFEELHTDKESDQTEQRASDSSSTNTANNKEVLTLVRAFNSITDPQVQKKVLSLIKSLSVANDIQGQLTIEEDRKTG